MPKRRSNCPLLLVVMILGVPGCTWFEPRDQLLVYRQPWHMAKRAPAASKQGQRLPLAVAVDKSRPIQTRALNDSHGTSTKPPMSTVEVLDAARRTATQQPAPDGFINAVQLYEYQLGAVYEVVTAPGFVTAIRLRPGEQLLDAAAGDTARWLIDTTTSGAVDEPSHQTTRFSPPDAKPRTTVIVKPRRPMLQTNLIITTDQRTYLIDLRSVDVTAYHSAVEWTYPMAGLKAIAGPGPVRVSPKRPRTRTYAYAVKVPRTGAPPWTPVSVYHDGVRVFVEFPPNFEAGRRPPLFIIGEDDQVRLVNYSVDGDAYIVHERFDRAELRLGHERVQIEHTRLARPQTRIERAVEAFFKEQ